MATHEDDIFLDSLLAFDDCFPQAPFALAGFVAEQMFFAGLAAFQFARGGHAKAFLTAFMGLHLGHGRLQGRTFLIAVEPTAFPQKKRGPWPTPRGPKSI